MPNRRRAPLNRTQDIRIARDVGTREDFRPRHDLPHRLRSPDLSGASEGGDEDLLVAGVEEPVGRDGGEDGGVVAGDCDVAAGKGRREAGEDGGEVVADSVRGRGEELVAKVGVDEDVFDVRPVGSVGAVESFARG